MYQQTIMITDNLTKAFFVASVLVQLTVAGPVVGIQEKVVRFPRDEVPLN